VRPPAEGKVVIAILGANRKMFFARINFDARVVEPVLRVGIFNSIYLDFILVPGGDVNRAIDVVELDTPSGVMA
jgi:hypothetical protein